MRGFDFGSWQGVLTTLIGLALLALIGVGLRLLLMVTIQRRRERLNRQINERLRTLIAAYKVLGGSFTGDLIVDPSHRRDRHRPAGPASEEESSAALPETSGDGDLSERRRRIRDAVEASLSDIILLGTEEQVRLADQVAHDLVAGRPVRTRDLVISLRDFIRKALDIDPIPSDLAIPEQGPTRPSGQGGRGGGERGREDRQGGGGRGAGGEGSGSGGGGMAGGIGVGAISGAGDHS
ncbi:MAG: hypothetical protein KIT76_07990 [Pseudolabrys sp.]|nr:hypothetical protein [Pseudolabrys sp.]MCW5696156.1 hypothetical protein [Bauldia sp.]